MTIYTEDLTVIGNGVIGSLTALMAAKAGMKVALCGPYARPGSASLAAGAMLNVYGEIDGPLDDYGRRKLDIGTRAIAMWRRMLPEHVFVADRTEVYLKNGAGELERKCFEAIAGEFGQGGPSLRTIALHGEPAVSTPALFKWLDDELRQNLRLLPNNSWQAGPMSTAPKTVYCAGAFTTKAMGPLGKYLLPLFFGVGTAMVISDMSINIPERTVVRTPNRGNTCGLHVVPRGDGSWYVGAGSYIAEGPTEGYRIETLSYLQRCLNEDLGADTWRAFIEPVKGYRPMSFDGKPMLGTLREHPDVYVATGTKRDGLTYAPVIAEEIVNWALDRPTDIFKGWEPDRKPISFGERGDAVRAYADNRLAAMAEHGRTMERTRAIGEAMAANDRARTRFGLPDGFGLHPEIVGVL